MFRYKKLINEYELPPLEVSHLLLISLRLGRHITAEFWLTNLDTDNIVRPMFVQ